MLVCAMATNIRTIVFDVIVFTFVFDDVEKAAIRTSINSRSVGQNDISCSARRMLENGARWTCTQLAPHILAAAIC